MTSIALSTYPNLLSKRVCDFLSIVGASLFIAACAQIKIPLFFTPVPLSLQTFALLLVGCMFGSRRGALAASSYVVMAVLGLPVLSSGLSGWALVGAPTMGYLIGFVVQAYLAGWYIENMKQHSSAITALVLCLICGVQLALGTLWLGALTGWSTALMMGVCPFLPGEILKSLAVTALLKNAF